MEVTRVIGYCLYSLAKKDFIVTNDATLVLASALNSSVINKLRSEDKVNKIDSELTTTVGALAITGSAMYNLSFGPYSCNDGINLQSYGVPIIFSSNYCSIITTRYN